MALSPLMLWRPLCYIYSMSFTPSDGYVDHWRLVIKLENVILQYDVHFCFVVNLFIDWRLLMREGNFREYN